ncbi:MAG: hypothetical protein ABII07_04080 [Patescibacteria group bacterium]|nr:hypothetical protein [Patescibacteria group bacterium]
METQAENIFDPEQFRADLEAKTEDYATSSHITYGSNSNAEEIEHKKARAEALYNELLDECAEALLATDDKEGTMEIIRTTLVRYQNGNHAVLLFAAGGEIRFYRDLSLRLAMKASAQ